ncbi:Uncharacterised protein [uncultured archaeon]|nr:Uncharacterised protein [uncultured archaeon]
MRRMIVLLMVLLLAIPVLAQPDPCGNELLNPGEECDNGGNDQACPGDCDYDTCTCRKESAFVLFDLAIGHNLLFSKVQDLLHTIKDMLFQLEMKTIEIQLTDFNCSSQPVSFWIPAEYDPYGKLNEIDGLVKLTIQSLNKSITAGGVFGGITAETLQNANLNLSTAEQCIVNQAYREAFECKCLAYRVTLLNLTDNSVQCNEDGQCNIV